MLLAHTLRNKSLNCFNLGRKIRKRKFAQINQGFGQTSEPLLNLPKTGEMVYCFERHNLQIEALFENDVDNVLEPMIHVVDDDVSLRTALTRLLSCAGYAVKGYASAGEFLVNPSDTTVGCILLDLELGGPNGLDVQQTMLRQNRTLPIVFMSAYSDVPSTVRAMKSGAVDFLLKPFDRQTLLNALQAALNRRGSAPALEACVRKPVLDEREQSVLGGIMSGKRNREIAANLGLSERTIKSSRANLMRRFGATSLAELIRRANAT